MWGDWKLNRYWTAFILIYGHGVQITLVPSFHFDDFFSIISLSGEENQKDIRYLSNPDCKLSRDNFEFRSQTCSRRSKDQFVVFGEAFQGIFFLDFGWAEALMGIIIWTDG